jgi:DNA-binding transcriptional LysR family regulator
VKLLHRKSKGVALTDYGEAFAEHAAAVLGERVQFRNQLQRMQLRELGQIKLGVGEAWWECFVKQTVFDFRAIHPSALLHVQFGNNLRLFEQLMDGEIDMLIGHEIELEQLSGEYKFKPLFTDMEWIYMDLSHPLSTVEETKDYPVLAATPYMSKHTLRGEKNRQKTHQNAQYEVDSLYASVDLLLNSDAVMPYTNKLAPWLKQRGLKAVAPKDPRIGVVGIYWRSDSLTEVTKSLLEEIEIACLHFNQGC